MYVRYGGETDAGRCTVGAQAQGGIHSGVHSVVRICTVAVHAIPQHAGGRSGRNGCPRWTMGERQVDSLVSAPHISCTVYVEHICIAHVQDALAIAPSSNGATASKTAQ